MHRDVRAETYQAHLTWQASRKRLGVSCVVCGDVIDGDWAAHEYLVKRNAVAPERQDLILVPENTVFMHNHRCHLPHGQSREVTEKCLWHAAGALTAEAIGEWYVSLWKDHDLSVPQGQLVPPETLSLHRGRLLYNLGKKLVSISEWDNPTYHVEDVAFAAWTDRWRIYRGKVDKHSIGPSHFECLEEGFWMHYLLHII